MITYSQNVPVLAVLFHSSLTVYLVDQEEAEDSRPAAVIAENKAVQLFCSAYRLNVKKSYTFHHPCYTARIDKSPIVAFIFGQLVPVNCQNT